jgi:hypothetical protein
VEIYCGARELTDDSLITGMPLADCIIMASSGTESAYVIRMAFFAVTMVKRTRLNVKCIRTLPVLLKPNFAFGFQVRVRVVSRWTFCQPSRNKDKRY